MKPGRELDAWIAEKVMGNPPPKTLAGVWPQDFNEWSDLLPLYSTDIAAAWEVVEKFRERDRGFLMSITPCDENVICSFIGSPDDDDASKGESAPHAICLAALKAVGAL